MLGKSTLEVSKSILLRCRIFIFDVTNSFKIKDASRLTNVLRVKSQCVRPRKRDSNYSINRMMLNSRRHTQLNPLSYRVKAEEKPGETQKDTTHKETKTKLRSATPNRDKKPLPTQTQKKASRQQRRSGISILPTPSCESLQQQQQKKQKTRGFGKDWQHKGVARLSISNWFCLFFVSGCACGLVLLVCGVDCIQTDGWTM